MPSRKEDEMDKNLDKAFLLTYTAEGEDGFSHFCHAWFKSEENLRMFWEEEKAKGRKLEEDLAIEILDYRPVDL